MLMLAGAPISGATPTTAPGALAPSSAQASITPAPVVVGDPLIPSAGADRVTRTDRGYRSGHAWVAIPALSPRVNGRARSATLMHIPPRDGEARSAPGTVRRVTDLTPAPQGMIALGERVYIIFPRETTQGTRATSTPAASAAAAPSAGETAPAAPAAPARRTQRRVVSFAASPLIGNDGFWDFNPMPSGRSEPILPGEGELVDACVTAFGPSVLLAPVAGETDTGSNAAASAPATGAGPAKPASWRLLALDFSAWTEIALPREIQNARWVRMVDGMLLAQMAGETDARAWRIASPTPPVKGASSNVDPAGAVSTAPDKTPASMPVVSPTASGVPVAPPAPRFEAIDARIALPPDHELRTLVFARVDGQLMCTPHTSRPEALWSLAPGRPPLLIAKDPLPEATEFAFVPLTGASRIAYLTAGSPATASSRPQGSSPMPGGPAPTAQQAPLPMRQIRVVEISTSTGQVLFNEAARRDAVITASDLQALAIGIGVLTAAVFLFVLRQDNRHTVRIPLRTSLATPSRRFTGALIDLVFAYGVAALLLDRSMFTIITQAGPHVITNMMSLIVLTLLCAAIHSMFGEWLTGRSLGKFITGSIVTRAIVERGDALDPPIKAALPGEPERAPVHPMLARAESPASDAIPPITFAQAGLRNLIRWTPPLAMLLAFDPNFRHPGDVLSRTVVIVPDPEDEMDDVEDE